MSTPSTPSEVSFSAELYLEHLNRLPPECKKREVKDPKALMNRPPGASKVTREKHNEYQRTWVAKNKEHRREWDRNYKSKKRKENPELHHAYGRRHDLKRRFRLTIQDYLEMLASQNNRCAICQAEHEEAKNKRLHVDHCHKTNLVRGLLCNNCNNMLGKARDNVDLLLKGAKYLEHYAK